MRLAYFIGCNTYGTDPTYGSLNGKTKELGVDVTITHASKTYPSVSGYFAARFYAHLAANYTVSSSLTNARKQTLEKFKNSANAKLTTSAYKITGSVISPGSVKLKPAAYGVS